MSISADYVPQYCSRPILVLGCGNILLGDDGFGPGVIAYFQGNRTPRDDMTLLDAGTGVVDILFNIVLSEIRPRQIILVDIMDIGKPPGTLAIFPLESIQKSQVKVFSQHQIPTSGMLQELREFGIEIIALVIQPGVIPAEICPGLSTVIQEAIPFTCDLISRQAGLPLRSARNYNLSWSQK